MTMAKKPELLSAFTRIVKPTAVPDPTPATSPENVDDEPMAPTYSSPSSRPAVSAGRRTDEARKNLVYRTSRANWLRIRQLALADDISVQDLFHLALSHEFERRGLKPLDG